MRIYCYIKTSEGNTTLSSCFTSESTEDYPNRMDVVLKNILDYKSGNIKELYVSIGDIELDIDHLITVLK